MVLAVLFLPALIGFRLPTAWGRFWLELLGCLPCCASRRWDLSPWLRCPSLCPWRSAPDPTVKITPPVFHHCGHNDRVACCWPAPPLPAAASLPDHPSTTALRRRWDSCRSWPATAYWDPLVPRPGNLLLVQLGQWAIFALSAVIFLLASDLGRQERWLQTATFVFLAVGRHHGLAVVSAGRLGVSVLARDG